MKKITSIALVMLLATLFLTTTAFASEGAPMGSCPRGYDIHHFMDHSGEHMHAHIGLEQDLNADGYICMREISPGFHLHIDNYLP